MKRKILLVILYTVAVASLTVVLIERNCYASSILELDNSDNYRTAYYIYYQLYAAPSEVSNNSTAYIPSESVSPTPSEEIYSESDYVIESNSYEYSSAYCETISESPIVDREIVCKAPAVEIVNPETAPGISDSSSSNAGEWDVL